MKTASVNVRIQENVKAKAEEILDTMGVSRATAIDMFYRQIIMHNGIPFPVTIPSELPARDALDERRFNALMSTGTPKRYRETPMVLTKYSRIWAKICDGSVCNPRYCPSAAAPEAYQGLYCYRFEIA